MMGSRNLVGRNYASTVKNQNIPTYCDASWALAAVSVISDRFRLMYPSVWPVPEPAAQVLINCDSRSYGCEGGSPLTAFRYIQENGIPDETCMPYTGIEERCRDVNICRSCSEDGDCEAVYDYSVYSISDYGSVSGELNMQTEIYRRGPIACSLYTNSAFRYYHSGIFTNGDHGNDIHYVTLVGWGEEDGIPFWIARNSWGTSWGESGYIRLLRGRNLLGVESSCFWSFPALSRHSPNSPQNSPSFSSCGFPTDWSETPQVIKSPIPASYVNISALPAIFDIRRIAGIDYSTPDHSQRSPQFCNACWAQATAAALSDRLQISRGKKWPTVEVSAQAILNCAQGGCNGGDAGEAYRWVYSRGVGDKTCQAYEGRKKTCDPLGRCMDCDGGGCWPVTVFRTVGVSEYGEVSGAEAMMAEIYERGPITCFMVMTEEFLRYEGGVFVEHDHNYKGGHIVEVTGWGVTSSGKRYWIVRNNLGEYWGEKGWFRIVMGGSNLLIETSCSWGVPYLK